MSTDNKPTDAESAAVQTERLFALVQQLAAELHPRQRPRMATADSNLERDFGFDSLSRVELLQRIERTFGIQLSETAFANAETLRDLCALLFTAKRQPQSWQFFAQNPLAGGAAGELPERASTLLDVLEWHVATQPQRPHIYLYGENSEPEIITYADLLAGARAIAAGLAAHDLAQHQCVAIMLPTGRDYLHSFFGILCAGGIPVPIYPPARLSQIEDHLRRHAGILANADAVLMIAPAEAQPVARLLQAQVENLRAIVSPSQLRRAIVGAAKPAAHGEDIAFLQYTSGSTGQPKGVTLSHANVLANIRAMGEAAQVTASDCFVSWLPLYHDMGLIGAWLGCLYHAAPLVLMSPLQFVLRPQRWLWTIHRHRATLSAAPNFAYELCLNKIADADLVGLDLSSLRMAFNGAEPVSPQTVRRFCARFAAHGFRPTSLAPVYGLAEAAVGLAFPPPARGPLIDRIQRNTFAVNGNAVPARPDDANAMEFVACGQPLPGYQIRVVDAAGHELPERYEGRLEFRGPSATTGYYRNPEATRHLFDGVWLDSGDLAYIAAGDVYLTSRIKDIIIRAGRNIYPYEVETAVGDVPGIRKGCVAVFGSVEPQSGTERIIVLAETRIADAAARMQLREQVQATATDVLGMPPDDVALLPPQTLLKTSSGKIRRAASRELYEQGRLDVARRAVWWQIARLAGAGLLPQWRRLRHLIAARLYGLYVWIIFAVAVLPLWLLLILLPRVHWRWRVARRALRGLLRLCGIPLAVCGLEHLPKGAPCVLIANHSSYLDSLVLTAVLPLPVSFVAKAELKQQFFAGRLLRALDTEFVERFDQQQSVSDARRLANVARSGRSLLFFPEGTFQRMPGLRPFHLGAFNAALAAKLAVVPIALRGTRSILRDGSWLPHRGNISVTVGAPIKPSGTGWHAAIALRDETRAAILKYSGEPDLGEAVDVSATP